VRIAIEGDHLVVRDGPLSWDPRSRQLLLDFAAREADDLAVTPLNRPPPPDEWSADDWYELGTTLEESEPEKAREAYVRAVTLDPLHADALIDLGRMHHSAGDPSAAADHYRRALEARPDDAVAAFNLGVAMEDLGKDKEAYL